MKVISAAVLSALFCTVKEEHRTAFFGEDVHIDVPPGNVGEVVFKPRTNRSTEVVLLRAGKVMNPGSYINTLGHLVLEDVQEKDEGLYVIKNTNSSNVLKHLILIVRDCALEEVVKYGETYYIHLNHVEGPITLEFRRSLVQPNQTDIHHATESPPVVLYNQTAVSADEYVGRLSVSEKRVTLHSVKMTDEGSFTVLDHENKIRRRNCLNVREHQNFLHLSYGGNLKMKLYLHYSNLNIVYRRKSDNQDRLIVDQGVLVTPLDPMLEGRLTVEGSLLTDEEAYKLPPLTVAILSLVGLIAFMLLVCLLSCIYKMHRRNEKSKRLMLIAQQAGKGDGEAFRQVVHEAYTRFAEESLMQSVCEKTSESTEVTIKGLEVSKPGRYHTLSSENFMEMSDSGVEFTSGLPLDSDTDAAMTYASHKPLLNAISPTAVTGVVNSDSLEATLAPQGDLSASRTPDSVMSASPASNPRSLAAATP
ncbi:hypothetical protein D5F01_LYC19924 [Larimichthys crocea]|uniref:Uncharacterized protein n=1 Tax=Larimichthys crocea TaxID=215358 RepID=A0A6G0HTI5_LARCR|nr:hypothetical protein D5F01_LYC19924 [Larimichthys crocea]